MEIHYFFIEGFRNIKGQPITLSSKFIFKTNIDLERKKGEITINLNPEFIENFFDKSNIKNVSAIVGKNGAGKTSIFDFILSNFPEGVSANVHNNIIIAYSKQNSNDLQIMIPKGWEVEIINESNNPHKTKVYDDSSKGYDTFRFSAGMDKIDFFYYNFFLDYKIDVANWHGIKNLSTSTLLCQPRKRIIDERWNQYDIDSSEARTFDLNFLISDEISKAIQLLISDKRNIIPFTTPYELNINISQKDYIYFSDNKTKKEKEKEKINSTITTLLKQFNKINNKKITEERVINNFYIGLFINFLVTHFYYSTPIIIYDFNFILNSNTSIRDFIFNFFKNLTNLASDFGDYKSVKNDRFEKLSIIIPEFIELVEEFSKNKTLTFQDGNPYLLKFPLTEKTNTDFSNFISLYLKTKGLTNYLEFGWGGLSTGQQSFLSLMSRFHHEKNHAIGKEQIKENIFIMIDECDAGFHPDWQKQIFNKSLNFLSDLFTNHNIQLVYASNSPYILSDLPKNHITFIENKENEVCVLEKNNDLEETFAQNIHTLLSNAFFLDSGLIGEFAKNKINDAIRLIKLQKPTNEEINKIKNTISIIGEPVIKLKLNQLFEDRFGFPVDIKHEISNLEDRLSKLKMIEDNDKNS
jgi:hypothetical protein